MCVLTDSINTINASYYAFFFFLKDPPTPEIYPLPPHDALPISIKKSRPETKEAGLLKSRRMCPPPPPKGEKERGAAGGSRPRHALSLLLLPPQAASLS